MPEISILIPCHNESENLTPLVERLERVCLAGDIDAETIILDDASEDQTIGVAKSLQAKHKTLGIRVVHRFEPRRGYGALIRYGMAHARGRYCLLVTSDGAHPIEMLPAYLTEARSGAQLVQCSRYERAEDNRNIPMRFKLYLKAYRAAVRLLLAWDVRDPTCSFRLVDRVLLQSIGIRSNGLSLVPEITLKVFLSGGRIAFIPGSQSFRKRGISQFRFVRESTGYAYVLLRASLHRWGLQWF